MKKLMFAIVLLASCGKEEPAAAARIVDPVCGMEVDPASTKFKSGDKVFCTEACLKKYEKQPQRFAMGPCVCPLEMDDCGCGHCEDLAAGRVPKQACPCYEKQKGAEHKHDH